MADAMHKRKLQAAKVYKLVIIADGHYPDHDSHLEETYILGSAYECAQVIDRSRWYNMRITSAVIEEVTE